MWQWYKTLSVRDSALKSSPPPPISKIQEGQIMKDDCYWDNPSGHAYNVLDLCVIFTQNTEPQTLDFAGELEV